MATQSILIYEDPEQALEVHRGGRDAWWLYAREVLSHLRLPFRVIGPDQIADVAELDPAVLLFTCPPDLRESDLGRVGEWIASGGSARRGGPLKMNARNTVHRTDPIEYERVCCMNSRQFDVIVQQTRPPMRPSTCRLKSSASIDISVASARHPVTVGGPAATSGIV